MRSLAEEGAYGRLAAALQKTYDVPLRITVKRITNGIFYALVVLFSVFLLKQSRKIRIMRAVLSYLRVRIFLYR